MPTKTESKPSSRWGVSVAPVQISAKDQQQLANLTDIDKKQIPKLVDRLQKAILHWSVRLESISNKPTPPHVKAALLPIEKKARELAELLDTTRMPAGVIGALDIDLIGQVWHAVTTLQVATAVKIEQLEQVEGRGLMTLYRSSEKEAARDDFGAIFDEFLIGEEIVGDKAEFIKICTKYLSKP